MSIVTPKLDTLFRLQCTIYDCTVYIVHCTIYSAHLLLIKLNKVNIIKVNLDMPINTSMFIRHCTMYIVHTRYILGTYYMCRNTM